MSRGTSLVLVWAAFSAAQGLVLRSNNNLLRPENGSCYKSIAVNHTGCLSASGERKGDQKCVNLSSGSLTETEKNFILGFHNRVRAAVASGIAVFSSNQRESVDSYQPKASGMLEMKWDEELALLAQKWANQCPSGSDCPECRAVPRFKVGQNIRTVVKTIPKNRPRPKNLGNSDWSAVLRAWYETKEKFDHDWVYKYPKMAAKNDYEAYSQLVWDKSHLVGCGYAGFEVGEDAVHVVHVCNYGPAGNEPGQPVYLPGKACTKCPKDYKCIQQALCSQPEPKPDLAPSTVDMISSSFSSSETKCLSQCHPFSVLPSCDVSTFQKTACSDQEICCQVLSTKLPSIHEDDSAASAPLWRQQMPPPRTTGNVVSRAQPSSSSATTSTLRSGTCRKTCVRASLASKLCKPESLDFGVDDCPSNDVCCDIRGSFPSPTKHLSALAESKESDDAGKSKRMCHEDETKTCVISVQADILCVPGTVDFDRICPDLDSACCILDRSRLRF